MRKRKARGTETWSASQFATEEDRFTYVLSATDQHLRFYQGEVNSYWFLHMATTAVTLAGTALTPLLALILPHEAPHTQFWIALPSGLAGLAAAVNAAFQLKDGWIRNYFALNAIDLERDRFLVRASPEYAAEKTLTQAIDKFQNRISTIVTAEVTQWRQEARHGMKADETH
ncbi:MAG TPA: DUF4231 domain-containing protein [Terracidiphilus sp.]|nr:DUF4231 domain-containing protein [Terracidiphilus sp.]